MKETVLPLEGLNKKEHWLTIGRNRLHCVHAAEEMRVGDLVLRRVGRYYEVAENLRVKEV